MSRVRTYEHVRTHDGRVVAVPVPKGSTGDSAQFTESVLGLVAAAAVRRLIGRR